MNELSLKRFVAELQVGAGAETGDLRKLSTDSAACIIMWPTIVYHMQRSMAYRAVHLGLLACRLHFAVFSLWPPTLLLPLFVPPATGRVGNLWLATFNDEFNLNASAKFLTLLGHSNVADFVGQSHRHRHRHGPWNSQGALKGEDSSVLTALPLVFECLLSCLSMSLIIKLEIS